MFFALEHTKKAPSKVAHNQPIFFSVLTRLPKRPKTEIPYHQALIGGLVIQTGAVIMIFGFKFSGQNVANCVKSLSRKSRWLQLIHMSLKSQNCNFRIRRKSSPTVWLFDANNNFKITIGPPMNYERSYHGCGIFHSSFHSGRPLIVTAGGGPNDGAQSSEIWDFTVPGSQWQLSKQ